MNNITTPAISPIWRTVSFNITRGFPSKLEIEPNAKGPTIMPANNSPRTAGSLSLLKSSANIFAAKRRIASEINTRIIDSCSAANLIFHQQFNIINIHSICLKAVAD